MEVKVLPGVPIRVTKMSIKEIIKDKRVTFEFFRAGELHYKTEDGFHFVVPVSDTGDAVFKAEDKAIFFMRWIRKQVATNEEGAKG